MPNVKKKIEAYIQNGDEVIGIGIACGLPKNLVYKTPSDGLCGKTDEDNLGFTYRQLNEYIRMYACDDPRIESLIDHKHAQNVFKLKLMPVFEPKNLPYYNNDSFEGNF